MNRLLRVASASMISIAFAACGGGGGSGGRSGNTPPISQPTPSASGQMQLSTASGYTPFGNQPVAFSCGCTSEAGSTMTDANGNYTIPLNSAAIPQGNGTYSIVPGRNYIVVAGLPNKAQSWTIVFVGSQPSRNVVLSSTSDLYTAAAALYVYNFSDGTSGQATAFDGWNINSITSWVNVLKSGNPTSTEMRLIADIKGAQVNGASLYPSPPGWQSSVVANQTIAKDLAAVHADPASSHPTPCPNGVCEGAPTP